MYCFLFVVETKNRTLEETAALFDGEEVLEQIEHHAAVHAEAEIKEIREEEEKESNSSLASKGASA